MSPTELRLQARLDRGDFSLDIDLRLPGQGVTAVSYTHLRAHET